jgi:hypothetical protein
MMRMSRPLRSTIQLRANERTAAFDTLYTEKEGKPLIDAIEPVRITEEPLASSGSAFCTADSFSEGASYVDPLMASEGHAAIDGMVQAVQERFPGHRFRRAGEVDGHHDRVRFGWELAAASGPVIAKGTDFATVAGARLATVTGFIDQMPG